MPTWMWRVRCGLLLGCVPAQVVLAQATVTIPQEYAKLIQSRTEIASLGSELFGDTVNLYTGSLSFTQTDLSLPGNSALPVVVGRSFEPAQPDYQQGLFGDWDLEIPHIHGVFSKARGWEVGSGGSTATKNRCTQFAAPPELLGFSGRGSFAAQEYWSGTFVYIPGRGDQELLKRNPEVGVPDDGQGYPVVTRDGSAARCLPTLAATSSSSGEGFELLTPDGLKYRFNQLASRSQSQLEKDSLGADSLTTQDSETSPNLLPDFYIFERDEVWLLPTEISDRFGNTVIYSWDATNPWKLNSISSNDDRVINLVYTSDGKRIQSITGGTSTWTYAYSAVVDGYRLTSVLGPDQQALPSAQQKPWTFALESLRTMMRPGSQAGCAYVDNSGSSASVGTMTHPSGAVGTFTLASTIHGRSFIQLLCGNYGVDSDGYSKYPAEFVIASIREKQLSGPGLPGGMKWTYTYGSPNNCYAQPVSGQYPPSAVLCDSGSPTTKTITVTDPSFAAIRYTFGNKYLQNEGQLQRVERGWNGSSAVQTTTTQYATPEQGPYPTWIGTSFQPRNDGYLAARYTPVLNTTTVKNGRSFSSAVSSCGTTPCFDVRGRATKMTRLSSVVP